jgi:hypothetical protein
MQRKLQPRARLPSEEKVMSNVITQLIAMRDQMKEDKLEYYAEHIDYIIGLLEDK